MAQNVHLPNFASLAGCRLVALAETRPKLAQAVAKRYGIPRVCGSHRELADDPEVDAVAVSGAFDLQGEIAADLLRAGKPVFMEKPMAVSVSQAERILAAAREGNAQLTVAYHKRYDPGNELARKTVAEWLTSEAMGAPIFARCHSFGGTWLTGIEPRNVITTDEPLARGIDLNRHVTTGEEVDGAQVLYENLPAWLPGEVGGFYVSLLQEWTHHVNLLRFLLGAGDKARVRTVDLGEDPFGGVVVLELAGVRSVVEIGATQHHRYEEHTQIYFERGWVKVQPPMFFVRPSQSTVEIYEGASRHVYHHPIPEPFDAWPYREEAAAFVASVRSGEPSRSGGEDTVTDVRLFEDIFRHHLGLAAT
jgi:predicted dehydrogenase